MLNPKEAEYCKQVYPEFDFDQISKMMKIEDLIFEVKQLINDACYSLEGSCKNLAVLTEDGYSDFIAERINGNRSYKCKREEDQNGHVDLKITSIHRPESEFCYNGEAKVWGGDGYLESGFLQLTTYLTGREDYAFIIIYFDIKKVDSTFSKHIDYMVKLGHGHSEKKENRNASFIHDFEEDKPVTIHYFCAKIEEKPENIKEWIKEQKNKIHERYEKFLASLNGKVDNKAKNNPTS